MPAITARLRYKVDDIFELTQSKCLDNGRVTEATYREFLTRKNWLKELSRGRGTTRFRCVCFCCFDLRS